MSRYLITHAPLVAQDATPLPRLLTDCGPSRYSGLVEMVPNNDATQIGVAYEAGPEPGMQCTGSCSVRFQAVTLK